MNESFRKAAPYMVALVAGAGVSTLLSNKPSTSLAIDSQAVEAAPKLRRCTGVDGDERAGFVSVHEFGIDGCWVAFHKPWDHDPDCSLKLIGSIDADHHFDTLDTSTAKAYRDRIVVPGAKERMKFHYECK